MPQLIEEPDLIRCEYAESRGWPSTFRLGSRICLRCDKTRCRFHPRAGKTTVRQTETFQTEPMAYPQPTFKPKSLMNPRDLTSGTVLENFPSPDLRAYQKEIIVRIVEEFQAGKKCIILAAPTGFGKSYLNTAFASVTRSFYRWELLSRSPSRALHGRPWREVAAVG